MAKDKTAAGPPATTSTPLTGSALIKALKAASDPPQAGGPRKIALAAEAWTDAALVVPRKADVLRDWVLEAWSRGKAGAAHPLLDPAYHELLVTVSPSCAAPPAAPLALLTTYITCCAATTSSAVPPALSAAASASFALLFSDSAHKAESWAELWAKLVTALASPTAPAGALEPVACLVCDALASTLPASANGKKIAASLQDKLQAYAATVATHPSLRPVLEPLTGPLFLPLQVLQTIDPLKPLLASLLPATPDAATLIPAIELVPHLFSTFIEATNTNRFTLYARAERVDRAPLDVIIADRTRGAVIPALASCLDLANRVEGSVATTSLPILGAVWATRRSLWERLLEWGGYLESDSAAGALVVAESQRASTALAVYGTAEADAIDEGLAGTVLRTLDALERLDHDRAALGTPVVGWCLASPPRAHTPARALLTSVLRFHQLTHSLGSFVTLVADSVTGLFDPSLPSETFSPLYTLVAAGPLADTRFASDLAAAVRAANLGNRRGNAWAAILNDLGTRTRAALEGSSSGKRKRVPGDAPARLAAVLSRLARVIIDAGARAREGDVDVEGAVGAIAYAFDVDVEAVSAEKPEKKKKRKSDTGRDPAADLVLAARVRVARSARLLHRGEGYGLEPETLASVLQTAALPELRLEIFNYLYTHLALTAHDDQQSREAIVDAILAALGGSAKRPWTGREARVTEKTLAAATWTLAAQRGLSVLDVSASTAQLNTLAALLVERATDEANLNTTEAPLSVATAVRRVLGSAETWELASLRSALLRALLPPSRGTFAVLAACPAPWLTRPARAALLEAAYAADADSAARPAIRTWLARLAAADVFGPLGEAATIKRLVKTASGAETETTALLRHAYAHIARTPAAAGALAEVVDDTLKALGSKRGPSAIQASAATCLFDALAQTQLERHASLRPNLERLSVAAQVLRPTTAALAQPAADASVFSAWRSVVHFTRWLGSAEQDKTGAQLLSALLKAHATADAETDAALAALAPVALDLCGQGTLAAFIVLWSAFPTDALDTAMSTHLRSLSAEQYGVALTSAVALAASLASATASTSELAAVLRALRLILTSPVEGSGRLIAASLYALLVALSDAARARDAAVLTEMLGVVGALLEARTGLLRAPDAGLIIASIATVLLPGPSEQTTSPATPFLLPLALNPLLTLVRHRADLALAHLPALVGALASAFPLLQRVRGTRAARARAASRRPFWLASDPHPDPCEAHAALLARTLVSLATARLPNTPDAPAKLKTLAGPLGKHAPTLLVAFSRAAADPWLVLPPSVRRELEPGLFALCDVVTAGGRADGRGREGEGVGVPFGLGEAGGEAEREVWAGMWRAWARKRYTGKG